jgi:hypothetical protein
MLLLTWNAQVLCVLWGSRCCQHVPRHTEPSCARMVVERRVGTDLEGTIPEFRRTEKTHGKSGSRQHGTSCKGVRKPVCLSVCLCPCKPAPALYIPTFHFLLSNNSNNEPIRGSESLLRRLELFVNVFTRARHWNPILSKINPVHTSHSTF